MARILLTPSQVSVLITAFTVFLCTSALFLSGYAIQQRTLRDLREAIKPRQSKPSPQAYLPDYFKQLQVDAEIKSAIFTQKQDVRTQPEPEVIEVRETAPETEERQDKGSDGGGSSRKATKAQIAQVEAIKAQAAKRAWAVENPDPLSKSRVPISSFERRRMIKDEIRRLAHSEKPVYYQRRLW